MLIPVISLLIACTELGNNHQTPVDEDTDFNISVDTSSVRSDVVLKKSISKESDYSDVYKKTLFNPERTFVEKEETVDTEPTPTPPRLAIDLPDLELVGTLKTSGPNSYAFIRNKGEER